MTLLTKCDQCGGGSFAHLNEQILPSKNARGETLDVVLTDVMCTTCGLIFRNPRPTGEEFKRYYEQRSVDDDSAPAFVLTSEHRSDTSEGAFAIKQSQFEYFARHLGEKRGRVLEVGSFEGLLLSFFKDAGWEAIGVEPSVRSSKIAHDRYGLQVTNEFLRPGLFTDPFDAVMMVHVLEHVESPLETLTTLRGMIKDDGLLFIEVPNILTFPENNLSSFFNYEHLYYFSPRTLASVLGVAGFEIVEIGDNFGAPLIRAIARPGKPQKIQSAYDEFDVVLNKLKRQQTLVGELKNKVADLVSQLGNKRVVIYGAGVHTELLNRLTTVNSLNIVGVVDIEKRGTLFGHEIHPIEDIPDLKPDAILISSYAYQEEIYKNLKHYEPKIQVIKLYDHVFELENMRA